MGEPVICQVCGVGPECSHMDGPDIVPIIWRKDDPMAPWYREIRKLQKIIGELRSQPFKDAHESNEIKAIQDELVEYMNYWTKFRREIRQILSEKGIRSNPGWTEEDILSAIRRLGTVS